VLRSTGEATSSAGRKPAIQPYQAHGHGVGQSNLQQDSSSDTCISRESGDRGATAFKGPGRVVSATVSHHASRADNTPSVARRTVVTAPIPTRETRAKQVEQRSLSKSSVVSRSARSSHASQRKSSIDLPADKDASGGKRTAISSGTSGLRDGSVKEVNNSADAPAVASRRAP